MRAANRSPRQFARSCSLHLPIAIVAQLPLTATALQLHDVAGDAGPRLPGWLDAAIDKMADRQALSEVLAARDSAAD